MVGYEKKSFAFSATVQANGVVRAGSTARAVAQLAGVNAKTAVFYFQRLRRIIELAIVDDTPFFGEVEVDECYFGGVRKGKRGRGAAGKTPVFGLLKRGGKVYAKAIPDARQRTLTDVICGAPCVKTRSPRFEGKPPSLPCGGGVL